MTKEPASKKETNLQVRTAEKIGGILGEMRIELESIARDGGLWLVYGKAKTHPGIVKFLALVKRYDALCGICALPKFTMASIFPGAQPRRQRGRRSSPARSRPRSSAAMIS